MVALELSEMVRLELVLKQEQTSVGADARRHES